MQKRVSRTIPFGWKLCDDTDYIEEIPEELEALDRAKWYLEAGHTMQATRNWLVQTTNREITVPGMLKCLMKHQLKNQ